MQFALLLAVISVAAATAVAAEPSALPRCSDIATSSVEILPIEHCTLSMGDVVYVTSSAFGDSRPVAVSSDGYLVFPLIGPTKVIGETPEELRAELLVALRKFVKVPDAKVTIVENAPHYCVVGRVSRPACRKMSASISVSDAIGAAGGYSGRAPKRVSILRGYLRCEMRASDLSTMQPSKAFFLKDGDYVLVP